MHAARGKDLAGQPVPPSADMRPVSKGYLMVRSQLVRKVFAANPHLSSQAVEGAVEAILKEIEATLCQGQRVELRGFGSFFISHRDARIGWNPKNGASVPVAAKDVLRFRASRQLLERINRDA